MRKISFIVKITLLLIFVLASVARALPPPCEFYPDSGYQGETLTPTLYLYCAGAPDLDESLIIFFDEPGIQVLEVIRDSYDDFAIKIKIEPYVSPGTYSPYVIFGNEVVFTPEGASNSWLSLTVLESPPQFSLYPEQPQRAGTYGLYLISGLNTNFENGSTFVFSDNPGIFSIFHFVVSPEYLIVMVLVEDYVEEGSYDLTMITENESITESGILKVIE